LAGLFALIRDRQLNAVVEIGTSNGGVFYGLCKLAAPTATMVSIDLPGGPFGGVMWIDGNKALMSYGKPKQKLEFLRFDSHKDATLKKLKGILGDRKIDLLFIDGDHTYKGVKQDYEMYSPLVAKGGLIVLHDICDHASQPLVQVRKFWKEVKKGKDTKEILAPEDKTWGGIGVIFK
jgi:predicted O-methyltransferase YrrM